MEATDREEQDGIIDAVGDMVETYSCLIKVRMVESAAIGGSVSVVGVLLFIVSIFVLLFTGLGAAWWIGDAMENMKAGFFIVGGFYLLIMVTVLLTAGTLILPWLRNLIVRKFYE